MGKKEAGDFLGNPVVKTVLSMRGVQVRSLAGKQRSRMPCGVAPQNKTKTKNKKILKKKRAG